MLAAFIVCLWGLTANAWQPRKAKLPENENAAETTAKSLTSEFSLIDADNVDGLFEAIRKGGFEVTLLNLTSPTKHKKGVFKGMFVHTTVLCSLKRAHYFSMRPMAVWLPEREQPKALAIVRQKVLLQLGKPDVAKSPLPDKEPNLRAASWDKGRYHISLVWMENPKTKGQIDRLDLNVRVDREPACLPKTPSGQKWWTGKNKR